MPSGDPKVPSLIHWRPPALFRRGVAAAFFYVSLALSIVVWSLPIFFIGVGSGTAVLRYNSYFGVDLTGALWQTLLVPAMTTFFFLVNTLLAVSCARRRIFASATMLMVASFFLQVAALIVMGALILVN